jgi:hypothetical protein
LLTTPGAEWDNIHRLRLLVAQIFVRGNDSRPWEVETIANQSIPPILLFGSEYLIQLGLILLLHIVELLVKLLLINVITGASETALLLAPLIGQTADLPLLLRRQVQLLPHHRVIERAEILKLPIQLVVSLTKPGIGKHTVNGR